MNFYVGNFLFAFIWKIINVYGGNLYIFNYSNGIRYIIYLLLLLLFMFREE